MTQLSSYCSHSIFWCDCDHFNTDLPEDETLLRAKSYQQQHLMSLLTGAMVIRHHHIRPHGRSVAIRITPTPLQWKCVGTQRFFWSWPFSCPKVARLRWSQTRIALPISLLMCLNSQKASGRRALHRCLRMENFRLHHRLPPRSSSMYCSECCDSHENEGGVRWRAC